MINQYLECSQCRLLSFLLIVKTQMVMSIVPSTRQSLALTEYKNGNCVFLTHNYNAKLCDDEKCFKQIYVVYRYELLLSYYGFVHCKKCIVDFSALESLVVLDFTTLTKKNQHWCATWYRN